MGAVSGMAQVNVRVDRQVKNRAEEVLRLSGGSLPELIKKVVAKVAQGGGQCEEVLAAVDDRQQTVAPDTPFAASWAAADQLYTDLASQRRPYPTIAIGTQSIPKPWTSAIAKGDDPVSGAPLKIMVDANVWVDSFCADHAESLAARAFIGQAAEAGALMFFPVHIAKDVLYVVQHELKRSVLASGERSTRHLPVQLAMRRWRLFGT